jgi:hypothetical protein
MQLQRLIHRDSSIICVTPCHHVGGYEICVFLFLGSIFLPISNDLFGVATGKPFTTRLRVTITHSQYKELVLILLSFKEFCTLENLLKLSTEL